MSKSRGFTLLEMIVTVLIFGIVGVIAVQLLSQSVRATEKVMHRSFVLGEWHRAMNILEQDMLQVNHRAIRDENGDSRPALLIDTEGHIEFTRNGWRNVLEQPRSELQRVGYFLHDNQLIRRYWTVLDRVQDSEPVDQLLLQNVFSVAFEVIDRSGREHYFWPPSAYVDQSESFHSAVAVRVTIDVAELGQISHLWLVPHDITPIQAIADGTTT